MEELTKGWPERMRRKMLAPPPVANPDLPYGEKLLTREGFSKLQKLVALKKSQGS
jgi:hypothetical protein